MGTICDAESRLCVDVHVAMHSSATMDICNCSYHEIFLEEGVPQLTSCCCCSIDAVWYAPSTIHVLICLFKLSQWTLLALKI